MPPLHLPANRAPFGPRGADRFDPRRTTHAPQPRPSRPPPRPIDAETVIARLEEAGHTLLCLPRTGSVSGVRQTRFPDLADALHAHGCVDQPYPAPEAIRITRMDQALAWTRLIPSDQLVIRRIVGCRCLVSPATGRHLFSWRRLARLLGAEHVLIRRWHDTGIAAIVTALQRDAALARSWDDLG